MMNRAGAFSVPSKTLSYLCAGRPVLGMMPSLPASRASAISSAGISTARVNAQSEAAVRNSQADTITTRLTADGVDSDAEMQRLLQYEQAYAANARVIQAIQTMMDQILGI